MILEPQLFRVDDYSQVTELGIVDRVLETNAEAVQDADLVILCIPVGACGPVAQEIAPFLKAGAIVSDVGSVKEIGRAHV